MKLLLPSARLVYSASLAIHAAFGGVVEEFRLEEVPSLTS